MKRYNHRSLGLVAILLLSLLLAACGSPDSPGEGPQPAAGGDQEATLRIGYIADVNYLQPITAISAVDGRVNAWIHDQLIVINEDGSPEPRLAEDWHTSDDGLTIEFKLRRGVKWHDGEPFTADDVAFTVYTILNPNIRTSLRPHYHALVGFEELTDPDNPAKPEELPRAPVEVVDEHTVRFHLRYPYAPFVAVALNHGIIPRHLLEDDIAAGKDIADLDYSRNPVGLGPFKFVEWRRDDRIVFERFDDYYLGAPSLKNVVFRIIPDRTVITGELEAGGIDFLDGALATMWDHLEGLDQVQGFVGPGLEFSSVNLNNEFELFQDVRVRQALRYAVDMGAIARQFINPRMDPATGPIPPSLWAFNPDLEPYPHDPERARELLAEAGWHPNADGILEKDGRTFSFTIQTFDFARERQQSVVAAQEYWTQIGLDVKVEWLETTVLLDRLNRGEYEAVWVNQPGGIDPDTTFARFRCDNIGGGNTTRYCNPEFDALLDRARVSLDQAERTALYHEALEILAEDQPALWAAYISADYWWSDTYTGFRFTPEDKGVYHFLHEVHLNR